MENTNRNSVLPPVPVTWECWEKHLCANTVAHVFIFPCLSPTLEKVCASVLVCVFFFFSFPPNTVPASSRTWKKRANEEMISYESRQACTFCVGIQLLNIQRERRDISNSSRS